MNTNSRFNVKKISVSILAMLLMSLIVFSTNVFASNMETETTNTVGVTYQTHIQNEGWTQGWMSNGALAGYEAKDYRLEGIKIKLAGNIPTGLGIEYRTHIQNIGWEKEWASDGEFSGSEGQGFRLEGIQIRLTGENAAAYTVKYRTHIQTEEWNQGWVSDGEISGSQGKGLRLEAIEIVVEKLPAQAESVPITEPETMTEPINQQNSVKAFGATGNGVTDDTKAIQTALNANDNVYIPDGTYMINAEQSLRPKSNQTITLSENAVLKALPSAKDNYNLIRISGVNNVTLSGGKIVGERYEHLGTTGEWGMGIIISSGSENIVIRDTVISEFWGDGIYLGGSLASNEIMIDNVTCDNNRRQGISITNAKKITISNSVFKNSNGTAPEAGIDLEPNKNQTVEDIKITNTECYGNQGAGLTMNASRGIIQGVEVSDITSRDNVGWGIIQYKTSDKLIFNNNIVMNNGLGNEIRG